MNFISWNTRGLGGNGKVSTIRGLATKFTPAIFGLVETKHSTVNELKIRSFWGADDFRWEDVPANHGSGGLILMWATETFTHIRSLKGDRWICIKGKFKEKDFEAAFVLVYGQNDRDGRKVL